VKKNLNWLTVSPAQMERAEQLVQAQAVEQLERLAAEERQQDALELWADLVTAAAIMKAGRQP